MMNKILFVMISLALSAASVVAAETEWLSATISGKDFSTILCSAANHYYYDQKSDEYRRSASKLWLKRGIELSKTEAERGFCEKIKNKIDEGGLNNGN